MIMISIAAGQRLVKAQVEVKRFPDEVADPFDPDYADAIDEWIAAADAVAAELTNKLKEPGQ